MKLQPGISPFSDNDSGVRSLAVRRYHGILPGFPVYYQYLGYQVRISEKQGICSFILSADILPASYQDPISRCHGSYQHPIILSHQHPTSMLSAPISAQPSATSIHGKYSYHRHLLRNNSL